jgi:hypothetical protein
MSRSMNNKALCAALVLLGPLCTGCATVDMGVIGAFAARPAAASPTPEPRARRDASAAFETHAEEAGWAESDFLGAAARRTIAVLIHGRDDAERADAALAPAEKFIQARALDDAAPPEVADALCAEIREARAGVRAVNIAAAQVVRGPERPAWSRREDVSAAETVVQLARRSRALFHDVSREVGDRLDRSEQDAVDTELGALDVELERLSTAADALSSPDPDVQFGEVDPIPFEPDLG